MDLPIIVDLSQMLFALFLGGGKLATELFNSYAFRLFSAIVIVSAIMMLAQNWHAYLRMIVSKSGFQDPVDLTPGMLNPNPKLNQMQVSDYVDRARRVQYDNVQVIPVFWVLGFLFVLTDPADSIAASVLIGFFVTRLVISWSIYTKQRIEVRSMLYVISTVFLCYMGAYTMFHGIIAPS